MSFEISQTDNAVTARFEQASDVVHGQLLASMRGIGQRLQAGVMQKLRGVVLGYRTGNLGRSIGYVVEADESDRSITTRVTQDADVAIYGRIQELGGEITPLRGQALTVPLEAALTSNGVPRFTAQQVREDPHGFGFSATFVRKGIIFGVIEKSSAATRGRGGKGAIVPLFVLKPSVRLPARPYMSTTFDEQIEQIVEELNGAVRIGSDSDTSGKGI